MSETTRRIVEVRRGIRLRAARFGVYRIRSAASSTRAIVAGATRGSPRRARETVDWLIASARAMSLLVTATVGSYDGELTSGPPRVMHT